MGLLSATTSVTRYRVDGKPEDPILESISKGLKAHVIQDIDGEGLEKSVGWTSFDSPFRPDFDDASFAFGTFFVFSLRIDKKSLPSKIIHKHFSVEMQKRLAESGRDYMSKNEKEILKEEVINTLYARIPATPNIYDILWNYEESSLWFFSNLKAANEELETLFVKSFEATLVRLFPYTFANLAADLSASDRDALSKLSPTNFTG